MTTLTFHYDRDLPIPTKLKADYLANQVKYLQTLPQHEQKSPEWYAMRLTMVSASDWGTILGENHYSNPNQVLLKKCGEDNFITNEAMMWGNKYEDVAIAIYEHRNHKKVYEFGCIRHPFINFLGASPDGITTEGVMLEIKCPSSRKITGIPPRYYWCQVQGQLEVCELDRCDFLECKLKEYEDEEEYLNDNYQENHLLNKYGQEKGILAELLNKETKSFFYEYGPIGFVGDELESWKNSIKNKYENHESIIFSSFDYWFLEEVSCVPIYRNQEWFQEAKVKLEEFWNQVVHYRKLGLPQLKADLDAAKEEKKKEKLRIKEEKEKIKEETKKQRKIKEYITFDDLDNKNSSKITSKQSIDANEMNENMNDDGVCFFTTDTTDTTDSMDTDDPQPFSFTMT